MNRKVHINKLILDIRYPLVSDGQEALAMARKGFENLILPELDKITDHLPDRDIRIGQINLDLGVIRETELAEKLALKMDDAFKSAANSEMTNGQDYLSGEKRAIGDREEVGMLISYLVLGYYSMPFGKAGESLPEEWLSRVLWGDDQELIRLIYELLGGTQLSLWNREQALSRLLQLVAPGDRLKFLERFSDLLSGPLQEKTRKIVRQLEALNPGHFLLVEITDTLSHLVLLHRSGDDTAEVNNAVDRFWDLARYNDTQKEQVRREGEGDPGRAAPANGMLPGFYGERLVPLFPERPGGVHDEHKEEPAPDIFDIQERTFIMNTGLVLLVPFLHRFFENAGLTHEDEFVSGRHRMRAAFLLHRIAEPSGAFHEDVLLLNKLLCGIPASASVDIHQKLLHRERQEIADLLGSVIAHWKALKNTTSAGFRDAFLRRKGTIEKSGADYLVRVETLPHDILMSSLPWSIGMTRFPWNDYTVHAEWNLP